MHGSFLEAGLAQRVVFIYAPRILGGDEAPKAVAGSGARRLSEAVTLVEIEWRRLGPDLLMMALIPPPTERVCSARSL